MFSLAVLIIEISCLTCLISGITIGIVWGRNL